MAKIYGRAKNWQKVAYLRRNPSPSVNGKRLHELYGKMLKFLESPELLFQRGAMVLKFGKNFIFSREIANF